MAGIVVVLVGALALFSVRVSGKDWCNLTCRDQYGLHQNTMCKYEERTSTKHCKAIRPSMTDERRVDLLKQHNEYRNKVAGGNLTGWSPAANMRLLTWNDDLEKSAQRWASQCIDGHDQCRRTPQFRHVGQNYAGGSSSSKRVSPVTIDEWTDEANSASRRLVKKLKYDGKSGHFTQVIWAKTHKLGCGEVTYKEGFMTNVALLCNYGPSGNFFNGRIYTKGKPCTRCSRGTKCFPDSEYPNLCATEQEIKSLSN